jgi:hypothetical protein
VQHAGGLIGGGIEDGADLEQEALVAVEDFFLVEDFEVYGEAITLLAKHGGMGRADEADHDQDEFVVGEGDGSQMASPFSKGRTANSRSLAALGMTPGN